MLYIEGTISCSVLLGTTEGLGFGSSFPDQTRERVPQTASRTRLNGIRTQHPNKKNHNGRNSSPSPRNPQPARDPGTQTHKIHRAGSKPHRRLYVSESPTRQYNIHILYNSHILHNQTNTSLPPAILNSAQPTPTPETAPLTDPMASAGAAQQVLQQPTTTTTTTTNNTSQPPALQIKLLSPTARAPTRGSAYAAGYDLYASKATTIPARGKVLVDTDISIAVPAGTYGRVAPRSGLASKHSIDVGAGVIDADYRGPVKVLLFNLGDSDFKVEVGERVAQLIVERVSCSSFYFIWDVMGLLDEVFEGVVFEDVMGTVVAAVEHVLPCCWDIFGKTLIVLTFLFQQIYTPEVIVVEELEETVRGVGGFGSTGGFGGTGI